jgi:ParB family chromosome partitioning protein
MPEGKYICVELAKLDPNPFNPRRCFTGPKMDELIASVKEHGVKQPIVVRSNGGDKLQIVSGERRYRAAQANNLETIPAIFHQDMTDAEAIQVMTIENLIREDLNEVEEAYGFKAYVDLLGEDLIPELALKTSKDARYIRRRLAVLTLSESIIKLWENGKLLFGHLGQLMRLPATDAASWAERVVRENLSVVWLKDRINAQSPNLKTALFDTKPCKDCMQNTSLQKKLFGDEFKAEKVSCLDPACYHTKTMEWLNSPASLEHAQKEWPHIKRIIPIADITSGSYTVLHGKLPRKQCKDCEDLVAVFRPDSNDFYSAPVCLKAVCPHAKKDGKVSPDAANKAEASTRRAGKDKEHAIEFREVFYRKRIPEQVKEVTKLLGDDRVVRVLLMAMTVQSGAARDAFKEISGREAYSYENHIYWDAVEKLEGKPLREALRDVALGVICDRDVNETSRHRIFAHFGGSLQDEWLLTEDFLNKKQKSELVTLSKKLKLITDNQLNRIGIPIEQLKKKVMIDLILENDLKGKVPKEVLNIK